MKDERSKVRTLQARILEKARIYMALGVFYLGCYWLANNNLNRIRFGMCFSRNNSPKILAISAYYCEFSALLNVKIPIPKSF
jgi:hypothetical protein